RESSAISARYSSRRRCSSGSLAARIRTASSPALRALPMATVATGTPAGIWTMESRESSPPKAAVSTGTPITGSGVYAAGMPGRRCGDQAEAALVRRTAIFGHVVGCAVRRDDAQLIRHAEALADLRRAAHRRKIGVAAHHDAHKCHHAGPPLVGCCRRLQNRA